ncbi:MAG: hypothetical protein P1V20_32220 [Verrucomicrobiales bacterium]|nr:hypothetical protein [Verrucomicrobiales bacterium]
MRPSDNSALWSQNDYDESEEFALSVRLSLLGVSPSGPASFHPGVATLASDWRAWCDVVFREAVGPVFRETVELAPGLKLREIAVIDKALGTQIGESSARLIEASRPFIEGKDQMRGHREWSKYIRKIESGEAPGHLPVVFALHSVLFRLPLASSLQAYAWFEWKSGHNAIGKMALAGVPEDPPALFLEVKAHISQILNPPAPDESEPGLRVV